MKTNHNYETETFVSLLFHYPDYFFSYSEFNHLVDFNKGEKLINRIKDLNATENPDSALRKRIELMSNQISEHLKTLKIIIFLTGSYLIDYDAWLSAKDLVFQGVMLDLDYLKKKKIYRKKDSLIKDLIFTTLRIYVYNFGPSILDGELRSFLMVNDYLDEVIFPQDYFDDEEDEDEREW